MPKTGRNIYKRKDGRWEGRYPRGRNANGKLIYGYVYGKSFAETKELLSVSNSNSFSPERQKPILKKGQISFCDVAEQWLSVISLRLKASTYISYSNTLRLHICPMLGHYKIADFTTTTINNFAKDKLEGGRVDGMGGLSAKTVRDMLSIIKSIIDFAYTENIIENTFSISYPKQQKRTMRVLSRQEQSSLESILFAELDIYKLGILLCLYTGLRIGDEYVKLKLKFFENIFLPPKKAQFPSFR